MPTRTKPETRVKQITPKLVEMLDQNPQGLRFTEIIRRLQQSFPNIPRNGLVGAFHAIYTPELSIVYRSETGLWRLITYRDVPQEYRVVQTRVVREQDFYQYFADYLMEETGDCTKAIPLGGNLFGDRWGTPDVIGKNTPKKSDLIQYETEIVSAEIKTNDATLITAFGQACAYKSFSHKVYIIIPKSAPDDDKSRIESLCLIFGIGLILFDTTNTEDPTPEIRVRPTKHEPDMLYTNSYMRKLRDTSLFGD